MENKKILYKGDKFVWDLYDKKNPNEFSVGSKNKLNLIDALGEVYNEVYETHSIIMDKSEMLVSGSLLQSGFSYYPNKNLFNKELCKVLHYKYGVDKKTAKILAKEFREIKTIKVDGYSRIFGREGFITTNCDGVTNKIYSAYKQSDNVLTKNDDAIPFNFFVECIKEFYGEYWERVLQFLAFMATPESKKLNWGLILYPEGLDFGVSIRTIAENIVGKDYFYVNTGDRLFDPFNTLQVGKRAICTFGEGSGTKIWFEKLKSRLNSDYLKSRNKYAKLTIFPKVEFLIILANSSEKLDKLSNKEKSNFCIVKLPNKHRSDSYFEYFRKKYSNIYKPKSRDDYYLIIKGLQDFYWNVCDKDQVNYPLDKPNKNKLK